MLSLIHISFHNEDKIKIIKDGQSSKATYYNHIHTLFSLYTLSLKQQDIMCNLCFLPYTGISCLLYTSLLPLSQIPWADADSFGLYSSLPSFHAGWVELDTVVGFGNGLL